MCGPFSMTPLSRMLSTSARISGLRARRRQSTPLARMVRSGVGLPADLTCFVYTRVMTCTSWWYDEPMAALHTQRASWRTPGAADVRQDRCWLQQDELQMVMAADTPESTRERPVQQGSAWAVYPQPSLS